MKITKKQRIISTCIFMAVLFAITIANVIFEVQNRFDLYSRAAIYQDISDFDFLKDYIVDENFADRKATNYIDHRCMKVEYQKRTYRIYACTFETKEQAWQYAEKHTGTNYQGFYEKIQDPNFHFMGTVNILGLYVTHETTIIADNKVLLIKGNGNAKDNSEFLTFLMEGLPQKVTFVYGSDYPLIG